MKFWIMLNLFCSCMSFELHCFAGLALSCIVIELQASYHIFVVLIANGSIVFSYFLTCYTC